jgi:hypothetical protein
MALIIYKSFFTTLFIYFTGITFSNLLLSKDFKKSIFDEIFIGFAVIGFVALFLNFFLPLSKSINTIVFIAISLCSIFIIKNFNKKEILKNFIYIFLITLLSAILIYKSDLFRPDAGLYHLPYTKILNEEKIVLGLSNLHFRFGHVSILQYVNAINFNFILSSDGILFPISILASTFLIFLICEFISTIKISNFYYQYFIALTLFFSATYLDRYSNYGNDASGFIYAFLCLIYFYKINNSYLKNNFYIYEILILFSVFSFLNKSFLILLLLIPLYFVRKKNIINILKNKITLFSFFFLSLWIIKNILISGCALYPSTITCLDLTWSNLPKTVYYEIAGEAASKGYLDITKYQISEEKISMSEFNKNFNWLGVWSKYHLLVIIEKLIPIIFFITTLFFYKIYFSKKKLSIRDNENIFILIISLLGIIIWFLKFPLYRYGISYIAIFIICASILIFYKFEISLLKKKEIYFISSLCLMIFLGINLKRIANNFDNNKSLPSLYFMGRDISYKKININDGHYFHATSECLYKKSLCTHLTDISIKYKEIKGYKIFY